MTNPWAWRGLGFSGGFVPLVGDVVLVPTVKRYAPMAARLFITQGARASLAGGVVTVGSEFHNRWGIHHAAARTIDGFTFGRVPASAESWSSSPSQTWKNRGVGVSTFTTRVKSRGARSTASLTGRKAPRGSRRNRQKCRNRYRGKRCRLSLGHRGRHQYR